MKEELYKNSIIRELYFTGGLSSLELSRRLEKSLSLSSRILNEMIEEGIVVEKGFAISSGGRRPQVFALNNDIQYIISVAMDQLITRIVIMDMYNNFVTEVKKIAISLTYNYVALQTLTEAIVEVIQSSGIEKNKFIGIGIGMPGFVDPVAGHNYTFLGANISKQITISTGLPVFIENDSSSIALAEYYFGAAKDSGNAMIINFNWGVGLGIIINGHLYRGSNGFAGEFSHIPMFNNGKMCGCGKTGCLETECSFIYMLNKAEAHIKNGMESYIKDRLKEGMNYEEKSKLFIQAVINGDKLAVELISEAGYNLGRGISTLIHLFNPSKIVLSGRGATLGKIWLTPIQQAINEYSIPRLAQYTDIEVSSMGYESELIGSSIVVMSKSDNLYERINQNRNNTKKETIIS